MPKALFQTKTVKIDTLGEYLGKIRNQLNLDVNTVSLLSQIKPSYIEYLEAGNYSELPADVYIRGFLKSLANFYHIKERLLIDQYEKERGFATESLENESKNELKITRTSFSFTPKTIVLVGSILMALLAFGYIVTQIKSVLAPPYLALDEPVSDQTVSGNSIVVSGKAEIGADVYINNQPVLIDAKGQFTENVLLSAGLNIIEVTGKNKFNKISTITRQITSQPVQTVTPSVQAVNLTLVVGPNSAWVSVEADGVVVQRGTMLAGSTKTISANSDIVLTSANAGSTSVIYNGKDLGKLGREDEVVRNVQFSSQ